MFLRVIFLFLLSSGLFSPYLFSGTIYFYKDKDGVLHFTDLPDSSKYRPFILYREDDNSDKKRIREILKRYCTIYNVDYELALAILKVESNFDPNAISKKGAKGLMQVMPVTQREVGITSPFDPEENIEGGVKYLRKLLNQYKDIRLVVAAYNAGPNAVKKYRGIPPFKETREYVRKVLRLYYKLKEKISLTNVRNL